MGFHYARDHDLAGFGREVCELAHSRRPPFRLPQPSACVNLVPGRDRNRLQDYSGHAALGGSFNPAQGLRALTHGQAHGGSGKDDRRHGPERRNRSTVHPVIVGDRPWAILPALCRRTSAKFFGMMVARDGVEPPTPAFSERNFQVVSTTYKVSGDCLTACKYVVGDGRQVDETGDRGLFSRGDGLRRTSSRPGLSSPLQPPTEPSTNADLGTGLEAIVEVALTEDNPYELCICPS
jgi:hypothetical protein